jgi:hypothetical protein
MTHEEPSHIAAQASGKHNVEVLFSDDGCGMSPEVTRQVFDPFFTTRRDQSSTGLGLHIVHNIVTNRLGGRINPKTRPGGGTKIRIIVPREAPFAAERCVSTLWLKRRDLEIGTLRTRTANSGDIRGRRHCLEQSLSKPR